MNPSLAIQGNTEKPMPKAMAFFIAKTAVIVSLAVDL